MLQFKDTCVELCKNLNISIYANNVQDCRCCLETYTSTFVCICMHFCGIVLSQYFVEFSQAKKALLFMSVNHILSFSLTILTKKRFHGPWRRHVCLNMCHTSVRVCCGCVGVWRKDGGTVSRMEVQCVRSQLKRHEQLCWCLPLKCARLPGLLINSSALDAPGYASVGWWPCVKWLSTSLSFLRDLQLTLEVLVWCCIAKKHISPWPLILGGVISTWGEVRSKVLMPPSRFFCEAISCLRVGSLSEQNIFTEPRCFGCSW